MDQAQAQEDQARSRLLPQISVNGSYSWNDYNEKTRPVATELQYRGRRGVLQARQALLDLVSYFRLQGAKAAVLQSEEQREAARMALGGDVVDRYLQVLQAADEIDYLQAEKEATQSQMKRLRFMRERQLAKVTDLYEIEAYYQGLLTREIEARNARAVALEKLREVSGVAAHDVAPLERSDFPAVRGTDDEWVQQAVASNRNLIALQHAIEAARQLVVSGRAEHLPQLSLLGSRTYSDQGFDNRALPPYWVSTIGVQLTIPLYEGGRVQGSIREATARYEIAREQYEASRREIERETRTAYLNASASRARIDSIREEIRSLETVLDAQRRSYELRVSTIVDVLIAQRRLFRSRSDESKARYDHVRDLTNLKVQAGRLTAEDIREIDGWMRPEPPRDRSSPEGSIGTGRMPVRAQALKATQSVTVVPLPPESASSEKAKQAASSGQLLPESERPEPATREP